MKKTLKIEKHDPVLYPRKLWVASELEDLDKVFRFMKIENTAEENTSTYKELLEDYYNDESGMVMVPVIHISDNLVGVLVIAMQIDSITPDMIPHEAVHVADYIYSDLGMVAQDFVQRNEQYAYLVGWAAGCISSSISKFKECKVIE